MTAAKPHKLAVVLSGGGGRGAAHLGIIKSLFKQGLVPDIYIGSSVGAIIAALMAVYDDIDQVIELYLRFVKKHNWLDLFDVPMFPEKRIHSFGGLIDGERVIKVIAEETGLAGLKLSQTKKPLYITATDLNSGGEIVFGFPQNIFKSKSRYQPLFYPEDILITKALRASIGLPVLFKPYPMAMGKRKMALLDGGIRDNCPFTLAAYLPDVKYILASILSYAGQQNVDYFKKDIVSVFLDFLEISTAVTQLGEACQDNIFTEKGGLSLRVINPGLFSINPLDIKRSQLMLLSSYHSIESIFNKFDGLDGFWKKWDKGQIDSFPASRWKIEKLGHSRSNIFSATDLKSPLEGELKRKSFKYRLKKYFS
jgi:NTE family protein